MRDDERIARLTELAQRAWPNLDSVEVYRDRVNASVTYLTPVTRTRAPAFSVDNHPRALDALEAALCVLAGEGQVITNAQVERSADIVATAVEYLDGRQPAWVEQLASEWERKAANWRNDHDHHDGEEECEEACNAEAKQVERCAAELRARAKNP